MIKNEHILASCPGARNLDLLVPQFNQLCFEYEINSCNRLSMFLAQCLHESGQFRYFKEIWGPTKWQIKYENNLKLGNNKPGDGKLFMGRGLIQLTGRRNYTLFSEWAKDPLIIEQPAIVADPKYAVLSAIFYWSTNNLNRFADNDDIIGCTKAVNGAAMLGLAERKDYYEKLKTIFCPILPNAIYCYA